MGIVLCLGAAWIVVLVAAFCMQDGPRRRIVHWFTRTCSQATGRQTPNRPLDPETEKWLREFGTMNMMAFEAYSRGQKASAPEIQIQCYTEALLHDPGYAWAYRARGDAYHILNDLDQAVSDYSKALELDPRCGRAYYGLAVAFWVKHDYENFRSLVYMAQLNGAEQCIPARLLDTIRRAPAEHLPERQMARA